MLGGARAVKKTDKAPSPQSVCPWEIPQVLLLEPTAWRLDSRPLIPLVQCSSVAHAASPCGLDSGGFSIYPPALRS